MMKRSRDGKEHSLRFLAVRAAVVVTLVVAALLAFRHWGVIVQERDVPATIVEETARDGEAPAPSSAEQPQEVP